MNIYTITNQRDGSLFSFKSSSFPSTVQPAWGQPARTKLQKDCDSFELPRSKNPRPSDPSDPSSPVVVDLPDDFTIATMDTTAQDAADAAAESAHQGNLNFLKNLKQSDLVDIPTIAQAVVKIGKVVRHIAKGD